jgi:hypothetical protein
MRAAKYWTLDAPLRVFAWLATSGGVLAGAGIANRLSDSETPRQRAARKHAVDGQEWEHDLLDAQVLSL